MSFTVPEKSFGNFDGNEFYTQFEIQGTILKGTALNFFQKIRDGNPEPFET